MRRSISSQARERDIADRKGYIKWNPRVLENLSFLYFGLTILVRTLPGMKNWICSRNRQHWSSRYLSIYGKKVNKSLRCLSPLTANSIQNNLPHCKQDTSRFRRKFPAHTEVSEIHSKNPLSAMPLDYTCNLITQILDVETLLNWENLLIYQNFPVQITRVFRQHCWHHFSINFSFCFVFWVYWIDVLHKTEYAQKVLISQLHINCLT